MIPKANYHTHTKYCDGKNTVAEMTKAAYEKGFTHLGFSGHGYTDFDQSYCMSKENIQNYLRDVAAVKAEYAGKMEVYAGVEQDCFSTEPTDIYDYAIGSTHYVYKDGLYPVSYTHLYEKYRRYYGSKRSDIHRRCKNNMLPG